MLNDCLRCHKVNYETEPDHWHFCNDCIKVCTVCKEKKVLWAFNFDFKSAEYKRWKASDCHGHMNASGHTEECGACIRRIFDTLLVKPIAKVAQEVKLTPRQLEIMLGAIQGKPRTTEPPDNP
jgi:hypothetical protein